MLFSDIDYIASNGKSLFHRAKPVTKILFTFFLLTSVILAKDLPKLGILIGLTFLLMVLAQIPLRKVCHLIFYPVIFSMLFALFRIQQSIALGVTVILKALGAALSMLFLIFTTPYMEIFACFSLFMPGPLVDVFLFTYRSFFILLSQIRNLLKSIRLRGGYHLFSLRYNLKNMASAVGVLMIHSFDMSERMVRIYAIRGYQGKVPLVRKWWPIGGTDCLMIAAAILILIGTVI